MQVYALKFYNFLRFGEKNNTLVFDLTNQQKEDLASGKITMDEIYSEVAADPLGHITKVKKRGIEKQLGIIGVVDGDSGSSNGAGKSTILDGICYAHYEKIIRKTANTDKIEKAGLCVVTKINGEHPKDLRESYVEEFLEDNGSIYRIKRGRLFAKSQKSSTPIAEFECISKGEIDSRSSHRSGDTKDSIAEVITMDYDVFVNSQMFGQSDAGKYLTGTDKTKKEMLISLLRLENVVVGCLDLIRKKKNAQDKEVESILSNINFVEQMFFKGCDKYIPKEGVISYSENMPDDLLGILNTTKSEGSDKIKLCDEKSISIQKQIDDLSKSEKLIAASRIKEEGVRIKNEKEQKEKEKSSRIGEWDKLYSSTGKEIINIDSEINRKKTKLTDLDAQEIQIKSQIGSFDIDACNKKLETIERAKAGEPDLTLQLKKATEDKQFISNEIATHESDVARWAKEERALQLQISNVKDGEDFICDKCKSKVHKSHILNEINSLQGNIETAKKALVNFTSKKEDICKDILAIESKLSKIVQYKMAEKKIIGEIKTQKVIEERLIQINSNRKDIAEEIVSLNLKSSAEKTKQKEYLEKSQEISKQYESDIDVLQNNIEKLREDFSKAKSESQLVENELIELKDHLLKIGQAKTQYSEKIGFLDREISHFSQLKTSLIDKRKEYSDSHKLLNRYTVLEGIYGLDGIQTRIVRKYLPLLNVYIKEFLDILSQGSISVKMIVNDRSKIDMEISGASADSYDMLSGGEKMIVRLAVDIGLALLSFSRSSQKPEIICLDEIFGCLDVNHRDAVFAMLEKLQDKFSRVLIISHEPDVCDRLKSKIIIEKGSGSFGLSEIRRIE